LINTFPLGNAYPTANSGFGASLGLRGSALSMFQGAPGVEELVSEGVNPGNPSAGVQGNSMASSSAPSNPAPVMVGNQPNILVAGLVFVVLLLLLMFTAHKVGNESDFKNIKVSAYNALVIGLAAVITIPVFKYLFTKIPVPGLSTWVMAS
jgi:hypothetical protein